MYLKEEITMERILKVSGIPLTPQFTNKSIVERVTRSKTGLWQVSESMEEWAEKVSLELQDVRKTVENPSYQHIQPILYRNREWVSDDSLLVDRACQIANSKTACTLLVVSNDLKLGKTISRTTGLTVALVHPLDVWRNIGKGVMSVESKYTVHEALGTNINTMSVIAGIAPVHNEILVDTGNLSAYLKLMTEDDDTGDGYHFVQTLVATGRNSSGERYQRTRLSKVKDSSVTSVTVYFANGNVRRAPVIQQVSNLAQVVERIPAGLRRFTKRRL
jgi:hypothetical protein